MVKGITQVEHKDKKAVNLFKQYHWKGGVKMKINNVYVGNNIEVLKTFPDNSIDSVVTDPPYGLGKEPNAIEVLQSWITTGYHEITGKGFMGKKWDAFVPQPNFWKEIYRVLKPGGYVLSFAGTRTYDWMVMAVRLAGFEIRDMIAWLYGSGFPKSLNVAKAISAYERTGGSSPKNLRKDRQGDDYKPTGQKDYQKGRAFSNEIKDDNKKTEMTDNAKQWQGWGTSLKPALEPIVMARKPLDGTVAQNVLKHGVGGINIDECRIGDEKVEQGRFGRGEAKSSSYHDGLKPTEIKEKAIGRFPANVIHDGSDEVVSLFPNTQSSGGSFKASDYKQGDGVTSFTRGDFEGYGDEGSASRFFYTAKASKEERNFGLYDFPKKQKVFNGKSDTSSNDMKDVEKRFTTQPTQNIHPTVKPIDLMRYLVRLVTPPNGICLDPYLGSGTTAIACEIEKFRWIGIELMPEYAEIAKARIGAVKDYEATLDTKTIIKESIKEDKEKELGIQNIFDFMEEELK
jgi:DNA modification methylase